MPAPSTALARTAQPGPTALVRPQADPAEMGVVSVAGREDVERIVASLVIPADWQYGIPKWIRDGSKPDGSPKFRKEISKVGLTADAYLYLNRALGVSFHLPAQVPSKDGRMVPNPIVQPDYIRIRLVGVWYNPLGQLQMTTEDVETDFRLIYEDARVNAKSAEFIPDPQGGIGNIKLSSEDELKALRTLSQLRTFGLRYAQTIARVRILKQASGVTSIPGLKEPTDYTLKVTGWRDHMTPQQRVASATADSEAFFGASIQDGDVKALTAGQIAEVAAAEEGDVEQIDRESVEAHQSPDGSADWSSDEVAEALRDAARQAAD